MLNAVFEMTGMDFKGGEEVLTASVFPIEFFPPSPLSTAKCKCGNLNIYYIVTTTLQLLLDC